MNALLSYVSASDLRIADRMRHWSPPRWLCLAMLAATRFGDGWGWAALVPALASAGAVGRAALGIGLAAAALALAAFMVLKRAIQRPRPCETEPHPLFNVRPPDRFSFPSGHTMSAFAVSTVLAIHFPALAPALGVVALGIGASRVVLGLHYVSDVVAGALLGTLIGGVALLALA
jgi:undecaprenyl-diphosphatase